MKMPEGIPNPSNKVYKLQKSLYGLKQASRQWFAKLHTFLLQLGYVQSQHDSSLFLRTSASHFTIVAVYVDDILVTGSHPDDIVTLKHHLHSSFGIKDLGLLHYFLGLEVTYLPNGTSLTQRKFTNDLLHDTSFIQAKPAPTPLPLHCKLSHDQGDLLQDPSYYRALIGKLNFLTHTRPDLSYTVQLLSQFMQTPRTSHLMALEHTLRYLKGTSGQGILLQANGSLTLQAFSDSDWASCPFSRRSVTGYMLLLGNSPISWKSKKQSTVSKSSTEAEYRAMSQAAAEVTWLVRLLSELGVPHTHPVTLHCDNQSALQIAKNPIFHERTKHIEVDCHFTRAKVLEGLLQLTYLPTSL
uniref:Reverse transcriptase Ty1/copia-type domain-containing protein n=1 Tax=Opuntia streptacantha TaxID=393608 RepID=A0A7C8YK69_OPUST